METRITRYLHLHKQTQRNKQEQATRCYLFSICFASGQLIERSLFCLRCSVLSNFWIFTTGAARTFLRCGGGDGLNNPSSAPSALRGSTNGVFKARGL